MKSTSKLSLKRKDPRIQKNGWEKQTAATIRMQYLELQRLRKRLLEAQSLGLRWF